MMQDAWPKYIEVEHKELVDDVKDYYLMIKKFKVSVEGEFNCPAKTVALFAHNDEFSYSPNGMPEIVKLVSEQCKTTDDIKRLV